MDVIFDKSEDLNTRSVSNVGKDQLMEQYKIVKLPTSARDWYNSKMPIMSCDWRALSSSDPHYIPIFRVRADDTVVVAIDDVVAQRERERERERKREKERERT